MFKMLVLVALFGISTLNAENNHEKTGFIQKIKNSPAIAKIVAIVPCLITFFSFHHLMNAYQDNPDKINIVKISNAIKWTALAMGGFLCRWLLEFNLRNSYKYDHKKCHDINESEPALIQS